MWTLGYSDVQELSFSPPFNGRKLRPLVPIPLPPSLCTDGNNFCSKYYHLGGFLKEQSKREFGGTAAVVGSSSRWNPTPEQLRILEELYRRGTRTPSAEQIQNITSQLLRFGKIEGKNVFYWFQNHKARERQKRRRQTADHPGLPNMKEREGGREGYEIEQTKKGWLHSKNCSNSLEQKSHGSDSVERNGEWNMVSQLGSPRRRKTTTIINGGFIGNSYGEDRNGVVSSDGDSCEESQTLQLFPLHSSKACKYDDAEGRESDMSVSDMNSPPPSFQFFEFLPLKN